MGTDQILIAACVWIVYRLWCIWKHDRLNRRRQDEVQTLKPDRLWYTDSGSGESGHRPGDQH